MSIGIAASYNLYGLAAVLSGTTLLTLRLLKPFKHHVEETMHEDPGRDESS